MTGTPPGTDAPRVLLVDDHELLAQTLVVALATHGVRAAASPLDSSAAVTTAAESLPADLVLLDLDLGGALGDGTGLVRELVGTGARVLVLTGSTVASRAAEAVEHGAVGVLRKDVALDVLVSTVVAAAHGEAVMDLQDRRALIAHARAHRLERAAALEPFTRLSPREEQVLAALADGSTVRRIAVDWYVGEATVRTQVRGVLTKLGVGTQLEAVALAHRSGWLDRRDGSGGTPPA